MVTSPSVAKQRLGDRLGTLRDKYFVGRANELAAFRSALSADASERRPALFFVHGPGGVGKTVLLRQFSRVASTVGARVVHLDGRDIEPSPSGFLSSLRSVLPSGDLEALGATPRPVLLLDTYEVLNPLDAWIREEFLPQLPDDALVVLAGRQAPAPAWRADPAWSDLARALPLRNLEPGDSRAYLAARGVPDTQHSSVLAFTHGHPLALSLLANLLIGDDSGGFQPEHAPDVVRTLLERFVERVPSPAHWQALAVCAHARVTTEALLADVLGPTDASALFGWLRELPFVEQGALGLFPHDIAREVLEADLRWRDPLTYRDLHARIRDALLARVQASHVLAQQGIYFDFLYLARHGTISKAYYDWASFGHLYASAASPADHPQILELVGRHEGEASARIAAYWLERQPAAFVLFRGSTPQIAGFATPLLLEEPSADDIAADPGIAAAWQCVARRGPTRPGERIMHHRFFVGRDEYQGTTIHNMVAMIATLRWLTTPRLAWSFPIVANAEKWAPLFESLRFPRTPEADFSVGGQPYFAFSHDWRVDPLERWIEVKTALDPRGEGASPARIAPLEVLSQPDFEAAVRLALRNLQRPAALAGNPLVRSRLVSSHAGGLRAVIVEVAEELRGTPRGDKLYRALECTYLKSAPTQELAAEHLGLPFNTYRYQLAAAVKYVCDGLWQREVGTE